MDPEELKDKQGENIPVASTEPSVTQEATPAVTPEPVAETTPVPPEGLESAPMAEEAVPVTSSDAFRNRIKSAYPDEEFADDEAFFGKASKQLDDLEQYRNNNMEANRALMEIFNAEPAVAEVLKDMIEGASLREALARHFSPEELTPAEGDPDREGWKKNSETRAKRLEGNELANKTKAENDEFSSKEIKEFATETGLEPDKAEEFLSKVGEALDEVYAGKISKSFLTSMWKAFNHEDDVKNAAETARITGRNEKIVTEKETKPKGDGMPILGSTTPAEPQTKKRSWMDNLVDNEKRKQIL